MENFIVSARKYRPTTFNSVVGQAQITTTVKNAIKSNHIAHAYLFCGPRGVGKTTCARIFAKTLNCFNPTDTIEACDECESCKAFNEHRSYNIHELDAASNNSVDEIRTLIEKVHVSPQIGQFSIYIIDEVHMLSTQAFNAFLKTLEEPPKHAIFILATTEKHKIIPTILSRCQIFDFNRIGVNDVVGHLEYVAQSEGVTVESEALNVIANKADGGMRDALSIFDQVVSFCGNNISYDQVIENLNVLDYDYYFKIVDAFNAGDVKLPLLLFNEILNKGFDGRNFVMGLSAHIRDVLVCKDPETMVLLEVGASIREKYAQQATTCDNLFLYDALQIANECDLQYRTSKNKRLLVELMLIRLAQIVSKKKKVASKDKVLLDIFSSSPSSTITKHANVPVNKNTNATLKSSAPAKKTASPPKPKLSKPSGGFSSFSLKAAAAGNINSSRKGDEVNEEKKEEQVELKEEVTQEKLKKAWLDYSKIHEEDQVFLAQLMTQHLPVLSEDKNSYTITLYNEFQEKRIQEFIFEISNYIRSEVKNTDIKIKLVVDETKEETQFFTTTDKLKLMVETNPDLNLLRKTFDLDLE